MRPMMMAHHRQAQLLTLRKKGSVPPVTAALATPTLSNYSTAGAAPLVLQWSTTDYAAGFYAQLQIDNNSDFSSPEQNIVFFVDGESWTLADSDINLATPTGLYYARIRVLIENENGTTAVTGFDPLGNAVSFDADASAWSTTFSDTITSSSAFLSTVAGIDFRQGISSSAVTGGGLTWTGDPSCGSTGQPCRSTIPQQPNFAHFEVTLVSIVGTIIIGFDNRTRNFTTNTGHPGYHDSTGIAFHFYPGGSIEAWWNSTAGHQVLANSAGSFQAGDIFGFWQDLTTDQFTVYRKRSGTTTIIGSAFTGPNIGASSYAWVSSSDNSQLTVKFDTTTAALASLSGEVTPWG